MLNVRTEICFLCSCDTHTVDVAVGTACAEVADALGVRMLGRSEGRGPGVPRSAGVPLTSGDDAVAAYLRRAGARTVLVVANLGDAPRAGLALGSAERALPPGRYAAQPLLGGPAAAPLRVGADGRISGYVPFPSLAPKQAYVLELSPESR